MDHAEAHGTLAHPEHRQGDVVLGDGARLFTCTKNVLDGSRTSMLLVKGLFRLDVLGRGEDFTISLRNISGGELEGGPSKTMQHRVATSFEGAEQHVSEFSFAPPSGPVGSVRVTISRPAQRGERFPCTAVAIVQRRAEA